MGKRAEEEVSIVVVPPPFEGSLVINMAGVEDDAGLGLTNVGTDDQAIPFLAILQSLSPQVQKKKDTYITGAEPGMILNTVTREIVDGDAGVVVLPVAYQRSLLEWRPREMGGGFCGKHAVNSPLLQQAQRNDRGQEVLPSGNYLVNTAHHYVLVLHGDGRFEQAVIAMASTQLKKSRRWNSLMKSIILRRANGTPFVPPSFLFQYRLTTTLETRQENNWFGWSIENAGQLEDAGIYAMAREYALAVGEGTLSVQEPAPDADADLGPVPF